VALGLAVLTLRAWRKAGVVRRAIRTIWAVPWARGLALGFALIVLAAGVPWVLTFPPPVTAAALGLERPSAGVTVGLLDAPPSGHYVPFRLGPQWDRAGFVDKIASQSLRFRFGEPWNPLNRAVPSCAMVRMADPAVIVTSLDAAEVRRELTLDRCAVSGYRVLVLD
jgi:hypothetical protein